MQLLLILIWSALLIIIIFLSIVFLALYHKSSHKDLSEIRDEQNKGVEKSKYYQSNISTLNENDKDDENSLIDLLPPNSLVHIPEPPSIPKIITNDIDSPVPTIPNLLISQELEVPRPQVETPKIFVTDIKDEKNFVDNDALKIPTYIEDTKSKNADINKYSVEKQTAVNEIESPKNLKIESPNKILNKKIEKEKKNANPFILFSIIGFIPVIGIWGLIFFLNLELHFYFLPLTVYFSIIGFIFYKKNKNKPNFNKYRIFLILSYLIEITGLILQTILVRFSTISFVLFFAILGVCIYTAFYGLKKKNKYIILLSIYAIGVEIVAKLYEYISQIFPDLPFWSYILVGGIVLLDITVITLNKWEKKEEHVDLNSNLQY